MPRRPSTTPSPRTASGDDVPAFIASLGHPFEREILAVRRVILDADASIAEGIKWNAPSFRTSEWFATVHLRAPDAVQVILHLGARRREGRARPVIDDPESLLAWLGDDRATVRFRDMREIEAKRPAFSRLVRRWIELV